MKHYSINEWQEFIEDRTPQHIHFQMQDHLMECDECMEVYLSIMEEKSEDTTDITLSSNFTDCVMKKIQAENSSLDRMKKKKSTMNMFIYYSAAACITLLLMSQGFFDFLQRNTSSTIHEVSSISLKKIDGPMIGWTDRLTEKTSEVINIFGK